MSRLITICLMGLYSVYYSLSSTHSRKNLDTSHLTFLCSSSVSLISNINVKVVLVMLKRSELKECRLVCANVSTLGPRSSRKVYDEFRHMNAALLKKMPSSTLHPRALAWLYRLGGEHRRELTRSKGPLCGTLYKALHYLLYD